MGFIQRITMHEIDEAADCARALVLDVFERGTQVKPVGYFDADDEYNRHRPREFDGDEPDFLVVDKDGNYVYRVTVCCDDDRCKGDDLLTFVIDLARRLGVKEARAVLTLALARQKETQEAKRAEVAEERSKPAPKAATVPPHDDEGCDDEPDDDEDKDLDDDN